MTETITAESTAALDPGAVAVVGIPFDEYSSFMRGPAKAPTAIRKTLHNGASNLFAENGVNLEAHPMFHDLGDLILPAGGAAFAAIETAIGRVAAQRARPLALGGDHAVTFPVVAALSEVHNPLTILHLDAHPDLYDSYGGSRFSHACPFARIMETGRVKRLVQVGVRGMNDEQRRQVEKFGVTCIEMKDYRSKNPIDLEGPVYISLDLDVLDPAYAPGVSHHEPGGMSTRKVLRLIQSLKNPIVGADIVELNPDRDINGMTAAVAAKFLKEIAGAMLRQAGAHS
ncbi:arginase [Desulfosarcina alkanivorans]|uniref:Arginase n=1 Tax=Desulfosarcina alkanivorans TaxID=571177 RepID=A0A5K7YU13_9BACT|nr:agmatinase [Desulfosarcina alkanivorans]BBO68167.1 arginase [Desulfosarcina alkanivorans]